VRKSRTFLLLIFFSLPGDFYYGIFPNKVFVLFQRRSSLIASTHLTVGAAVGVLSYRYVLKTDSIWGIGWVVAAGIVSHFLLDMIPHSEEELYRPSGAEQWMPIILSLELGLTFLAIYFCGAKSWSANYQNTCLMAGMMGGALPDMPHVVINTLKVNWQWLQTIDQVNVFFHTSAHVNSLWWGFTPQVLITALSLTVLCFFKIGLI